MRVATRGGASSSGALPATGTYADDDTFIVENRSFNGASGAWVLTPLGCRRRIRGVVNRGFLASTAGASSCRRRRRRSPVVVEASSSRRAARSLRSPSDPVEGALPALARVDLERVAEQVAYDVRPAYVQRVRSDPEEAARRGDAALVAARPPRKRRRAPTCPTPCSGSSSRPSRRVATRAPPAVAHDQAREEAGASGGSPPLDRELRGAARQRNPEVRRSHRKGAVGLLPAGTTASLGAMGFRAAGTVAPVSTPSDPRTLVMHGLRLKGFGERRGRR